MRSSEFLPRYNNHHVVSHPHQESAIFRKQNWTNDYGFSGNVNVILNSTAILAARFHSFVFLPLLRSNPIMFTDAIAFFSNNFLLTFCKSIFHPSISEGMDRIAFTPQFILSRVQAFAGQKSRAAAADERAPCTYLPWRDKDMALVATTKRERGNKQTRHTKNTKTQRLHKALGLNKHDVHEQDIGREVFVFVFLRGSWFLISFNTLRVHSKWKLFLLVFTFSFMIDIFCSSAVACPT